MFDTYIRQTEGPLSLLLEDVDYVFVFLVFSYNFWWEDTAVNILSL